MNNFFIYSMDILGKCSKCKKTVNLHINIKTGFCYKICLECLEKKKLYDGKNKRLLRKE
jgi:hypothetical protein